MEALNPEPQTLHPKHGSGVLCVRVRGLRCKVKSVGMLDTWQIIIKPK